MRKPKRVEVIGPPGAGKSTVFAQIRGSGIGIDRRRLLLQALRRHSTVRSVRIAAKLPEPVMERRAYDMFGRSSDLGRSYFRFVAEHPDLLSLVTEMTFSSPHPKARTWRLFQKHGSVYSMYQFVEEASASVSSPILLDEEFVQMLLIGMANTLTTNRRQMMSDYLVAAPLPDVVVAVRADSSTCARRVEDREGVGWPVIINSPDGPEFLERMAAAYDEVLDAVRAAGVEVIEVDNDRFGSVPDLGTAVSTALMACETGAERVVPRRQWS